MPGGGGIGLPDCDRRVAGGAGRVPGAVGEPAGAEPGTTVVGMPAPLRAMSAAGACTVSVDGPAAAGAKGAGVDGIGGRGAIGVGTERLPTVVLPGRLLDEIIRDDPPGDEGAAAPLSIGGRGPGATATGRSAGGATDAATGAGSAAGVEV